MGLFKSMFIDGWHQSGIEADIELGLRKLYPLFNTKHPAVQTMIKAAADDVWEMSERRSVRGSVLHEALCLMAVAKVATKCGLASEEDAV